MTDGGAPVSGGARPVVHVITDYRGAFWSSVANRWALCSMDVDRLRRRFGDLGLEPRVLSMADACADLGPHWSGRLVVYQSAEDDDLRYKSYVEDIVLGLELAGARVVPGYRHLRAHHNKVFGEILMRTGTGVSVPRPATECFGCLEEFERRPPRLPAVIKSAAGAGSAGVALAGTPAEARAAARRISRAGDLRGAVKEWGRRILRRGYVAHSLHRRKFLSQAFVPGLTHDHKVLCYGSRFFVLDRQVRTGDFRASGSGKFSWPEHPPAALLEFARSLQAGFDVPCVSLDVAATATEFVLLEAQFVQFGPLTAEQSQWHFAWTADGWCRREGPIELESVFADAVVDHFRRKAWIP